MHDDLEELRQDGYDKGYSRACLDIKNMIEEILGKGTHEKRKFLNTTMCRAMVCKIYDKIDEKFLRWELS